MRNKNNPRSEENPLPTSPLAGGGASIPSLDKGRARVGLSLPKLRFPEFLGAGEWEVKKIGNVLTIGNGKDYKNLEKGDIPVYGTGGYMLSVNDYLYDGESVCIGRKGTIDKPVFLTGKFWTVDTLFYTHSFRECLPVFVYICFQQINWILYSEASGVPSLSKKTIEQIDINIPTLPEQQKIADCLSTLDDRIEAENQKLTQLKTHKKALMQQLFPAEGETVPRLRFSEFLGAGEWEVKKIGNVLTIGNGKDYKNLEKGDIPVYGTGGYMLSVNDYLYDGESVCIGRKGTIDKPVFLTGKFWTVDTLFYTHSFRECLPVFVYICFQQINWILYSEASGVPSLSKKTIEQIDINIPTLPEQQKIADCLSTLDDRIEAENQKLTQLKTHKKALMQQLFPAEGETVPRLRFAEFLGAGEWEVKKLGDLAKKITIKNKDEKIVRVLTNSAIDGIMDQRDYFEKDIADKDNLSGYIIVSKGDYIYNPRISNIAPVGPISKNNIGLGVMSPLYTVFRFNYDVNDFYSYYFKSPYWHIYLREFSNSGARHDRMSISNDDFMKMPLPFPTLPEQQKISDCLSSLDELINLQTQKIATLKTHKKGMMQQLFPVVDGVNK